MHLAIVALGSNITYGIWLHQGRSRAPPPSLPFVLRGVQFIDDRVAKPAMDGDGSTGAVVMMIVGNLSIGTPWIVVALVLFVVVLLVAPAWATRRRFASRFGSLSLSVRQTLDTQPLPCEGSGEGRFSASWSSRWCSLW